MNDFMIFVAPFITVILSIIFAFILAPLDKLVKEEKE
ncbi:cytochrome bd oxidase small subunit CydS [Lysinibacillus yapensis]